MNSKKCQSFKMVSLFLIIMFFTTGVLVGCSVSTINTNTTGDNANEPKPSVATDQPSSKVRPAKKFKILHLVSYHMEDNGVPWEWTNSMFNGFKGCFKDVEVEYKTFELDAKRSNAPKDIQIKADEAKKIIDSWKPDLIYSTDDDAQKYVLKNYVNKDVPIVFAAVNSTPEIYGYKGAKNVAGVLEIEHFVESARLLKEVVPDVKKIAVVIDEAAMWGPVVERMKAKQDQVPELEFVAWDKILTFEDFKKKMKEYESSVDAVALLGIFNYKGADGKNIPYQEVQKWVADNIKIPDFSYWIDRASYGTLAVVSVSGFEQGLVAGKIARGILLEGKSPDSFEMKATTKGEPAISLARAKALGIDISSKTLLSTNVKKKYLWEENK